MQWVKFGFDEMGYRGSSVKAGSDSAVSDNTSFQKGLEKFR